jgi:hypothetical protein
LGILLLPFCGTSREQVYPRPARFSNAQVPAAALRYNGIMSVQIAIPQDLSRYFRQNVIDAADVQYERAGVDVE